MTSLNVRELETRHVDRVHNLTKTAGDYPAHVREPQEPSEPDVALNHVSIDERA